MNETNSPLKYNDTNHNDITLQKAERYTGLCTCITTIISCLLLSNNTETFNNYHIIIARNFNISLCNVLKVMCVDVRCGHLKYSLTIRHVS